MTPCAKSSSLSSPTGSCRTSPRQAAGDALWGWVFLAAALAAGWAWADSPAAGGGSSRPDTSAKPPAQVDTARQWLERGIVAAGGDRHRQARAFTFTGRGALLSGGAEIPFVTEVHGQLPDKICIRMTLRLKSRPRNFAQAFDGTDGHVTFDGKTTKLDGSLLQEARETAHAMTVTHMAAVLDKPETYTLTMQPGEVLIEQKPAVGVLVQSSGRRDLTLFFDAHSGRLVMVRGQVLDPASGELVTQEATYSGFVTTNGLTHAGKVTLHRNGQLYMSYSIENHKLLSEDLPGETFTKP